ncbi:Endonuclease/exonuclease/phosphatase [Cokeromyces recurvatus]|uniref:Endonuclease/exonuclease/phosphatase n=1 Tax=Cokeromyces recurvatus TaxID=90255 RepID=UPI00221F4E00|nr:Endonuclease/exonuclease/phosphatase [Cokeromyces recurvatus]KAI7899890.1 Endonuclease/exonuclease/phosphatase [Cokeromyces recurvatus]
MSLTHRREDGFDNEDLSIISNIDEENESLNHNEIMLSHYSTNQYDKYHQEFRPLLLGRISTRNDDSEEVVQLASPPFITRHKQREYQLLIPTCFYFKSNNDRQPRCFKKGSTHSPKNCFPSKKVYTLTCLIVLFLPLVSFVIFCTIYFSPISLPEPTTMTVLSSSSSSSSSSLPSPHLLTFNLFMRPPGIKNNENDYKTERLNYIIRHVLPLYDIITFQEAFAYANRRIDHLLKAAYELGFVYHVASSRHYPWDLGGDGGLLLLSRYPIIKANQIEFPRGIHSDWLSYKGALHALIKINPTHLIHIYTTHTQASYDNHGELNMDDTKVRLSQFALVHQFIEETSKEDTYPILLMGDLNVDAAIHDNKTSLDIPSYGSSLAYTMMMDVLKGKGTNLKLMNDAINNTTPSATQTNAAINESTIYRTLWRLDDLTDMAYKTFGYHPVTFGDVKRLENGTLIPNEVILTSHNQLLTVQSIDRILWATRNDKNQINMTLDNITVEHFFVDQKNGTSLPFTQLSDHYGLSARLYITK